MKLTNAMLTAFTISSQNLMRVHAFAPAYQHSILTHVSHQKSLFRLSSLFMKQEDGKVNSSVIRKKRAFEQEYIKISTSSKMDYRLSASSMNDGYVVGNDQENSRKGISQLDPRTEESSDLKKMLAVISAAFLVTSNTVGASMMVLPGLAQGPGMIASSSLFGGTFILIYSTSCTNCCT
jgi:hypothetical protein